MENALSALSSDEDSGGQGVSHLERGLDALSDCSWPRAATPRAREGALSELSCSSEGAEDVELEPDDGSVVAIAHAPLTWQVKKAGLPDINLSVPSCLQTAAPVMALAWKTRCIPDEYLCLDTKSTAEAVFAISGALASDQTYLKGAATCRTHFVSSRRLTAAVAVALLLLKM